MTRGNDSSQNTDLAEQAFANRRGRSNKVVAIFPNGTFYGYFLSEKEGAKAVNGTLSGVSKCIHGRIKTHRGLLWLTVFDFTVDVCKRHLRGDYPFPNPLLQYAISIMHFLYEGIELPDISEGLYYDYMDVDNLKKVYISGLDVSLENDTIVFSTGVGTDNPKKEAIGIAGRNIREQVELVHAWIVNRAILAENGVGTTFQAVKQDRLSLLKKRV